MTTNRYAKAISYNFLYFLLSSVVYLALTPLAIRVMGDELYGLWSILFAVAQFTSLGTLGIEPIVNKLAAEQVDDPAQTNRILSSALVIVLFMAALLALAVYFLRGVIARAINPSAAYLDQLNAAIAVYAVVIFPLFLTRVFRGFLLSRILNRFVRLLDTLYALLPLIGGVMIALYARDLFLMALWNLVVVVGVFAAYLWKAASVIHLKWRPDRETMRSLLGFSGYMFLESSAITLFQKFDRILVAMLLGPAAAGVYTVASGAGSRMSSLAGNISEVLIPYASIKHAARQKDSLDRTVTRLSSYVSILNAVAGGLLIVWMKEILSLWISPTYAAANHIFFGIMIAAYGVLSLSRPAHQTLIGLGRVKVTSTTYLMATGTMLVGLYFFSRWFGLPGAAAANALMVLLLFLNLYLYVWLDRGKSVNRLLTDLLIGLLPLAIALLMVSLGLSWGYRAVFSLVLLVLAAWRLLSDRYLVSQVAHLLACGEE